MQGVHEVIWASGRCKCSLGQEVVRELGAPTQTEVQRLFGVSPQHLQLEKWEVKGEDNTNLTIYPIELQGIPMEKLAGIRRLNLKARTVVTGAEHFVRPKTQVAADQGKTWLDYLANQLVQQRKEGLATRRGQVCLPSYEDLHAKAMELQGIITQDQVQYEEAEVTHEAMESAPVQDGQPCHEEAGFLPSSASRQPQVMDPDARMREAVGETANQGSARKRSAAGAASNTGAQRAKGRAGTGKRKKTGGLDPLDEILEAPEEEEDETANANIDWDAFESRDPEMFSVASAHYDLTGKVASCFHYLSPSKFLLGEKLGQVLNGATQLHA